MTWEGYDVHTMPPPSAGGLLLAQTLLMHDKQSIEHWGRGSADYIHQLAETFRGAIADRVRAVGDPRDTVVPMQTLLSEAHLQARRRRIDSKRARLPARFDLPEHGTTHLVVVDEQRNVVSLTTTVNRSFGAKIVAASSGVVLNDELGRLHTPFGVASLRRSGQGTECAEGGGRGPVSSMSPTIVLRGGKPYLALGGSGGMTIAPNVTQVALQVLAFGSSTQHAVLAPRFSVGVRSTELVVEPRWLGEAMVRDLAARGHQLRHFELSVGGADGPVAASGPTQTACKPLVTLGSPVLAPSSDPSQRLSS